MMKAAGVYRALVARRFGGDERTPSDFLRLIERISIADGSAGWVASFGFSAVYLSALPVATLGADLRGHARRRVRRRHLSAAAGARGRGRVARFGTAGRGAAALPARSWSASASRPKTAPAADCRASRSCRAKRFASARTGTSTDSRGRAVTTSIIEDVVVPLEWTFIRGGESSLDTPLFRYPSLALAAQVLAVVGLGVARAALDEIDAHRERPRVDHRRAGARRPRLRADRGRQERGRAALRARVFLRSHRRSVQPARGRRRARPASRQPVALGVESRRAHGRRGRAQAAYTMSGTTGIFTGQPIARFMQDAIVVPQHAFPLGRHVAERGPRVSRTRARRRASRNPPRSQR